MARELTSEQIAALLSTNSGSSPQDPRGQARETIVNPPLMLVDIYSTAFDGYPDYSAISNREFFRLGDTIYTQKLFNYTLPEEGDRDLPRSQLVIVRNDVPEMVRKIREQENYKGRVEMRVVLESDGSVIRRVVNNIEGVTITKDAVSLTLGNTAEFERRFSRIIFNPQRAPGVF